MKLISMVDYVNYSYINCETNAIYARKTIRYAKFLKQTLTLGMFVPCDLEGNVLKGKPLSPATDEEWIEWEDNRDLFFEAKERVLFKGFEVEVKKQPYSYVPEETDYIKFSNTLRIRLKDIVNFSMEFLVKYELELTESAIKQLK